MSRENLRIWDAVEVTDPKYTKPVSFGRKFTSIDAMYQIRRATEQFGPIGDGWGFKSNLEFVQTSNGKDQPETMAVVALTIWWMDDTGDNEYGPIYGMNPVYTSGKAGPRLDEDAPKKALTDALTKGLSYLGFSADVFLGKFDDNKYVQRAEQITESRRVGDSVVAIRKGMSLDDAGMMVEAWDELSQEDKGSAWRYLNTKEKARFRELAAALREGDKLPEDDKGEA